MRIKTAEPNDFPEALRFIRALWDYNTYEEAPTREVYGKVLADEASFAFFLIDDDGRYVGMCHGDYFQTFWMCGLTCYVSSLIVAEGERGKGYGTTMLDHAVELARARGCRAVTLDSGLPRTAAHRFYEGYGFEKSCYGFEMSL
ncbi:MAG: GNAT family N-acetyltransferase [Bifidobacteriaceae bacterium]|nr:GNAT family N-acetyltransferase [Bifidobacteriaceae bacterium]